jgi:exosortase
LKSPAIQEKQTMDIAMPVESGSTGAAPRPTSRSRFWWVLLLPFAWLWFHLIDNLRLEWVTDPQYSYSLVVPVLILGLLFRRWQKYEKVPLPAGQIGYAGLLVALAAILILLYLPTRLIEEATPEWRPIGWLLAGETIGLTLYAIYLYQGVGGLVRFGFPICFFLTAVPWPTLLEHPLVQGLSRTNAGIVVNVLGGLGVPAIQHGNVIEVSTGMVGVNDACSGIRSLQSSLMISLFLGEFYFLRWYRRVLLVLASFLLAMFFNVCRTSFLTYLAAKHGTGAIARYHDEAGMTILLACTVALWGLGYLTSLLEKKTLPTVGAVAPKVVCPRGAPYTRLALTLVVWIAAVEIGVEGWYAYREARIKPGPNWTMVLPEDNSTYQSLPITEDEHQLLRFDNVKQGRWQGADGTVWQAFYFDWRAGRVAGYLAKRHTPDICLPAAGMTLQVGPTLTLVKVDGLELPIRSYVFSGSGGTFHVFQCHWEPGAVAAGYAEESARFNLIRGVWAGRGNKGQKVFEIVVSGYNDLPSAQAAVVRELEKLIHIQQS